MTTLKKKLELSERDFYRVHMHIVNALLPIKLSTKEIDILTAFMSFTGTLAEDRFSTTGKKIVRETLGISNQVLWNHINALRDKKLIYLNDKNVLIINPVLFPKDLLNQKYSIELINKGKNYGVEEIIEKIYSEGTIESGSDGTEDN